MALTINLERCSVVSDKLSRRSFFRLAGGGIAAAIVAPKMLAEKVLEIPVEYGFTWHVLPGSIPKRPRLSEIITRTLRENSPKLADNITQNNAFLLKLKDGTKVQLKVDRISPKVQEQRIIARLNERGKARRAKLYPSSKDMEATFVATGYDYDKYLQRKN